MKFRTPAIKIATTRTSIWYLTFFSITLNRQNDVCLQFTAYGHGYKRNRSVLIKIYVISFNNIQWSISISMKQCWLAWKVNKKRATREFTAPFNNTRTLKFATVNQMFGGSSQLPTTTEREGIVKSPSTVQTTKQCSAVSWSCEEPPNFWLAVAKKHTCRLNFEF